MLTDIAVKLLAQPVQAAGAVAGVEPGRADAFALRQFDFARVIERFGLNKAASVRFDIDAQPMVAAPGQMNAPHFPADVIKCCGADHQRRKMLVRGASAPVFLLITAVLNNLTMLLEFMNPAAIKREAFISAFSNV